MRFNLALKSVLPFLLLLGTLLASTVAQAAFPVMGEVMFANGFDRPTAFRGGANYLWYGFGPACQRGQWALLPNYAKPGVRPTAQQQLTAMYAQGMRTVSIGVYFRDGLADGSIIDAGDPVQVSQVALNLGVLLDDIDAAGFERVLFRFFPQSNMNPQNNGFNSGTLPLYENLIATLRPKLALGPFAANHLIDLGVELAPADDGNGACSWRKEAWKCPANRAWSNYTRDLWNWYRAQYGTADTIGFSFLAGTGSIRNRVRHMRYVYGATTPAHLAIDVYGEPHDAPLPQLQYTAADQFLYFAGMVNGYSGDYGYQVDDLIIAESWHNDPFAAANLASAIAATGAKVRFLTEWPLDRYASCPDVSVPPPYVFDAYRFYGF